MCKDEILFAFKWVMLDDLSEVIHTSNQCNHKKKTFFSILLLTKVIGMLAAKMFGIFMVSDQMQDLYNLDLLFSDVSFSDTFRYTD